MATPCKKIAILNDAFLQVFEWEASPVEVQLVQQKDKKRRKRKGKKIEEIQKALSHRSLSCPKVVSKF